MKIEELQAIVVIITTIVLTIHFIREIMNNNKMLKKIRNQTTLIGEHLKTHDISKEEFYLFYETLAEGWRSLKKYEQALQFTEKALNVIRDDPNFSKEI